MAASGAGAPALDHDLPLPGYHRAGLDHILDHDPGAYPHRVGARCARARRRTYVSGEQEAGVGEPEARAVTRDLFDAEGISRVEPCGDKWRIYTDNPDRVVKYVVGRAERESLGIASLTISGPSLEEAFVQLTECE